MIFDTHAHYDDPAFDEDREELLASLPQKGITAVTNIGSSMTNSANTVELVKKYPYFYGAVGVHPSEIEELTEGDMQRLADWTIEDRIMAIGEIGLDYHYDTPTKDLQKKWFRRQMDLAVELDLPVVIHSRDAAADTMEILKEYPMERIGGVMHCFSYSKEIGEEVLRMGMFLGVGGVLTFKNGKKLRETVEAVDLDRIVIETDCPYLSPEPYRGSRNSSLNLTRVVETLAEIKGVSKEEVEEVTFANAKRLYRID